MTKEQITPFAMQITYHPQATIVTFKDNTQLVGFFDKDLENPADETNNFWSFVKFNDNKKKVHFNGNDVINIEIKDNAF